MSVFWAIRKGNALHPDGVESASAFAKLPFGKPVRVEVKQPRNSAHHRLFWALCARIGEAVGADPENVCQILKLETGHSFVVRTKKFGDVRLPKSIAFAKMDQTQFREFFDKCVLVIESQWGIARQDVLEAVEDLLHPEAA